MDTKIIEEAKVQLEKEKANLESELSSFAQKDEKNKDNWDAKFPKQESGDMEEEADEVEEYDNRLSLEQSLEAKLKNVNAALEKIAAGTYGKCEKCGKEIEEDRLRAFPEAKLCMQCNKA